MGVVTGIVQEFQFGMNWSEYSRFVGDIFGAPLAIRGADGFLPGIDLPGHLDFRLGQAFQGCALALTIWLVAIGANISALWILIANSFMQQPVGYVMQQRACRDDRISLPWSSTPTFGCMFPHTICAGLATAAFFVTGHQRLSPAAQEARRTVPAFLPDCSHCGARSPSSW